MATAFVNASAPGRYPLLVKTSLMIHGAGVGILASVPANVTASYKVEVSGDAQGIGEPINFIPHDTLGTTQTASATGNIEYPCQWIILNIASISGGSMNLSIVQPDLNLGQ